MAKILNANSKLIALILAVSLILLGGGAFLAIKYLAPQDSYADASLSEVNKTIYFDNWNSTDKRYSCCIVICYDSNYYESVTIENIDVQVSSYFPNTTFSFSFVSKGQVVSSSFSSTMKWCGKKYEEADSNYNCSTFTKTFNRSGDVWSMDGSYALGRTETDRTVFLTLPTVEILAPFTLSYDVNGGSTISSTNKNIWKDEKIGSLPTTTRSGYTFDGWYIDNTRIDENTVWTFNSSKTAVAHWRDYCYVNASAQPLNAGTISNSPTYPLNQTFNITATPNLGYVFSYWMVNGQVSYDLTLNLIADCDYTIVAVFVFCCSYALQIEETQATCENIQTDSSVQFIKIKPVQNYYINTIKFDTGKELIVNKKNTTIYDLENAEIASYVYIEAENLFIINIYNITANGAVYVTLGQSKNELSQDVYVDGVAVQSSIGGEARITENAELDEIVLIAVAYNGYTFSHWETSLNKEIIEGESVRINATTYKNQVIKAIFVAKNNNNLNNDLDNSADFY